MRGVMFTGFTAWVEATRGIAVLDDLLTGLGGELSSGGAYTAVGNYPSAELHLLAQALAKREGRTEAEVMVDFGQAAFPAFAAQSAGEVQRCTDLGQLLSIIESVIHTQVRKLYSDVRPPMIQVREMRSGDLEVTYSSHRDFTYLCRGLILGAARWFNADSRVRVISQSSTENGTTAILEVSGWRHVR